MPRVASIAGVARCFFGGLSYGLPRTQQHCLHAMIDTAVHAVASPLSAGSTAATTNIACYVAAIAFFSALMPASLDGRLISRTRRRGRRAASGRAHIDGRGRGAAGLASRIENEYA